MKDIILIAMHHLPDKARADHLNPGLVTHAGLILSLIHI